jgi:glucuronosyltransferase
MKILLLFASCLFVSAADCYKILGIFPFGTTSHYAIGEATLKALAEAGHEITMISVEETKKPIKNFKWITIPDSLKTILQGLIRKI